MLAFFPAVCYAIKKSKRGIPIEEETAKKMLKKCQCVNERAGIFLTIEAVKRKIKGLEFFYYDVLRNNVLIK